MAALLWFPLIPRMLKHALSFYRPSPWQVGSDYSHPSLHRPQFWPVLALPIGGLGGGRGEDGGFRDRRDVVRHICTKWVNSIVYCQKYAETAWESPAPLSRPLPATPALGEGAPLFSLNLGFCIVGVALHTTAPLPPQPPLRMEPRLLQLQRSTTVVVIIVAIVVGCASPAKGAAVFSDYPPIRGRLQ